MPLRRSGVTAEAATPSISTTPVRYRLAAFTVFHEVQNMRSTLPQKADADSTPQTAHLQGLRHLSPCAAAVDPTNVLPQDRATV